MKIKGNIRSWFKIRIIFLAAIIFILFIAVSFYTYTNLYEDEQIKLFNNISLACYNVMDEITDEIDNKNSYNLQIAIEKNPGLTLFKDDFNQTLFPTTEVSDIINIKQLENKIITAFHNQGMDGIEFVVAIQKEDGGLSLYSPDYIGTDKIALDDTLKYKIQALPIIPAASAYNNSVETELLVVIIKNYPNYILSLIQQYIIYGIVFLCFVLLSLIVIVRNFITSERINIIKNDFINNMTHELKTPLASLKIATTNIVGLKTIQEEERPRAERAKTAIIKEINNLNRMVETILKAGRLNNKQIELKFEMIELDKIIDSQYKNFFIQVNDRNGNISYKNTAEQTNIWADKSNIEMMVSNLIDNAIKYSKEEVDVTIETYNSNQKIILKIADKGIGMSKETMNNIFEKYYRAHTGDIHDVKGFGLGMTFVKSIIDHHKGKIRVESVLKKGSTIYVELPLITTKQREEDYKEKNS